MTDADGMDHPPEDPSVTYGFPDNDAQYATGSGWERGDYYGADRRRPVPTRTQLEAEVGRHKEKLRRAEEKLAALENIPDQDPYPNGAVLFFRRGQFTFVALRVNSFWYTTGRKVGVSRVPWVQFVDWMLEGRVDVIHEMTKGQAIRFGAAAALPVQRCERNDGPHKPHRVSGSMAWCDGSEGFGGTMTLFESLAPGVDHLMGVPRVSCTIGNVHLPHVWYRTPGGANILADERALCPGVGSAALRDEYPGVAALIDQIKTDPNRQARDDNPPEAHVGQGRTEEERIAHLTQKVALWRSVATRPLNHAVSESGIHVNCGLAEKHSAHLWNSVSGSLVTCEGRLADASSEQD